MERWGTCHTCCHCDPIYGTATDRRYYKCLLSGVRIRHWEALCDEWEGMEHIDIGRSNAMCKVCHGYWPSDEVDETGTCEDCQCEVCRNVKKPARNQVNGPYLSSGDRIFVKLCSKCYTKYGELLRKWLADFPNIPIKMMKIRIYGE